MNDNNMFMQMFSSLMNQLDNEPIQSSSSSLNEIKDQIVNQILKKLGLSMKDLETSYERGTHQSILNSIENLHHSRSHYEFLIVTTYTNNTYGYMTYKGTYNGAKRHALTCLSKEFHLEGRMTEDAVLISEFPIYTIGTNRIQMKVVPHAEWVFKEDN